MNLLMVGSQSSVALQRPLMGTKPSFLGGLCLCLHKPHRVTSHNRRIMMELLQSPVGPAAPAARISSLERRAGGGRPSSSAAGCRIIILHLLLSCLYDCVKPKVVIDVGKWMYCAAGLGKIAGIEVENGARDTRPAQWPSGAAAGQGFQRRLGQTKEQGWRQDSRMYTCVKILW